MQKRNTLAIKQFMSEYRIIVYLLAFTLIGCICFPKFATTRNFFNVINQSPVAIIGCVALNFMLVAGNIDLSAGYLVGLVSICIGKLAGIGVPVWLIIIIAVLMGVVAGLINGTLVTYLSVPAFIATLGSGYIFYGIAQIIAGSYAIRGIPDTLKTFGKFFVFGKIQLMFFYALAIVILGYIVMNRMKYGRILSNIGINRQAARMSGLNVDMCHMLSFVFCSTLVAFTAVLSTIRVNTAQADMGGGTYTFDAVMASVLGGTAFNGGKSNIIGGMFAVLLIKEIEVLMTILGINKYFYTAFLGVIVLIVIIMQCRNKR